MSERRRSWRFWALSPVPRRKRRKESTTTLLTWDAIRTSLEIVQQSADACPPLKSVVGAVGALCDLADASHSLRIATSDSNAEALTWRAFTILETIDNAIGLNKPVPPHLLRSMEQFKQLLIEIRTAMEVLANENRVLHVLRLRRNESKLAKFTARLDSIAELFTIGTMAVQTMSLTHMEDTVQTVSFAVEHSNMLLGNEVKFLRNEVKFFQITAVFLG
ncbi:hypothetical protein B0H13DRAFT_2005431 [Mycena leptocephala]|nr:hypothetical protein B0H13DRAFT_2005431 [Mycena leptocephala]